MEDAFAVIANHDDDDDNHGGGGRNYDTVLNTLYALSNLIFSTTL